MSTSTSCGKDPALHAFVLEAIKINLQHIKDIVTEIADLLTVGLYRSHTGISFKLKVICSHLLNKP